MADRKRSTHGDNFDPDALKLKLEPHSKCAKTKRPQVANMEGSQRYSTLLRTDHAHAPHRILNMQGLKVAIAELQRNYDVMDEALQTMYMVT